MCRNPYLSGRAAYGCGQCMPCRVNARRVWAHRIMLEASLYEDNAFVTLTYDDDHLIYNDDGHAQLCPLHLTLFFKRLRKLLDPGKIRYFAVGEYGDQTWRPHYHVALFNYPCCRRLLRDRIGNFNGSCCSTCDFLVRCWRNGGVHVGSLSPESASYICGYVVKKLTALDCPVLDGRYPEFGRMSLRPGIGADLMHDVGSEVMRYDVEVDGDVPSQLRHGKRLLPLGRYLRRHLRSVVGREKATPASSIARAAEEVSLVRAHPEVVAKGGVKEVLSALDDGRVAKLAGRLKREGKDSL